MAAKRFNPDAGLGATPGTGGNPKSPHGAIIAFLLSKMTKTGIHMIDGISGATWGTARDGAAVSLTYSVDGDSVPDRHYRIECLIKGGDIEAAKRDCLLGAEGVRDVRSGKAAARMAELKKQFGFPG